MKKIFTLIFCVMALCPLANANDDATIDRCINFILHADQTSMNFNVANLDVNHDGAINITDVTTLVNQNMQGNAPARPMTKRNPKVNKGKLIPAAPISQLGEPKKVNTATEEKTDK